MKVSKIRGTLLLDKDDEHYGLIEEIRLGELYIKDYGVCSIKVFGLETTDIPHFHIVDKDNNTICCICMFDCKYYRGHSKDDKIKLFNIECNNLDKIMSSNNEFFGTNTYISEWYLGTTHWEGFDNDISNWRDDKRLKPNYIKLRKRKD